MRALLEHLLLGHPEAVDLCVAVFECANNYDHIVDGDVTGPEAESALHSVVWALAVTLPRNPFYRAHQTELTTTLANSIATWRASVELQRGGDPLGLTLAHVLRWVPCEFFLHCARIIGGPGWEAAHAPAFWRAMTKDHSFAEFVAGQTGE